MDLTAVEMLSAISQKVNTIMCLCVFILIERVQVLSCSEQKLIQKINGLMQVQCTHSLKYACHQRQQRLPRRLESILMFSTVSSSWKPPASPLFPVQGLGRKKGTLHYQLFLFLYIACNVGFQSSNPFNNSKTPFCKILIYVFW